MQIRDRLARPTGKSGINCKRKICRQPKNFMTRNFSSTGSWIPIYETWDRHSGRRYSSQKFLCKMLKCETTKLKGFVKGFSILICGRWGKHSDRHHSSQNSPRKILKCGTTKLKPFVKSFSIPICGQWDKHSDRHHSSQKILPQSLQC